MSYTYRDLNTYSAGSRPYSSYSSSTRPYSSYSAGSRPYSSYSIGGTRPYRSYGTGAGPYFIDSWPEYSYTPSDYVYDDRDTYFAQTYLLPEVAEIRIRNFAEHQFREKSYELGLSPLCRDRSPIFYNTSKMMAIWRAARLDPLCTGVEFTLGYNKDIVAYDCY